MVAVAVWTEARDVSYSINGDGSANLVLTTNEAEDVEDERLCHHHLVNYFLTRKKD